jgi:hypothetical protein
MMVREASRFPTLGVFLPSSTTSFSVGNLEASLTIILTVKVWIFRVFLVPINGYP